MIRNFNGVYSCIDDELPDILPFKISVIWLIIYIYFLDFMDTGQDMWSVISQTATKIWLTTDASFYTWWMHVLQNVVFLMSAKLQTDEIIITYNLVVSRLSVIWR